MLRVFRTVRLKALSDNSGGVAFFLRMVVRFFSKEEHNSGNMRVADHGMKVCRVSIKKRSTLFRRNLDVWQEKNAEWVSSREATVCERQRYNNQAMNKKTALCPNSGQCSRLQDGLIQVAPLLSNIRKKLAIWNLDNYRFFVLYFLKFTVGNLRSHVISFGTCLF
ncbi:MAG: hypothetical protein J5861_07870 [Desulfovibrio sp.]|nr:hypothetical protein [Desulfovibrio sp.]